MGTWEAGSFGNDGALDWTAEFLEDPSEDVLRETLDAVIQAESRYDAGTFECECAVAAAEVVAAAAGKPSAHLPDELAAWLEQEKPKVDRKLIDLAKRSVARVRTDSEMLECWDDSPSASQWHAAMDDLAARLA